ncbi:ABC transporter permease [Lichenibacterium ramalinae]|uniref:ABC transporter permease n=1 Tax=Lichenibacterium ramalinae TaxID=2316527 RepID=A0A4Q2REU1_9HYPH|nr:ABC transporter permease [Lichenibacterium ramalinae]RYB03976.1 ABC transporter permease [Lichenibacterium ramalinae]
MGPLTFLLRRVAGLGIVMVLVALIVFVIVRIVPGDPAAVMLGASATPDDVAALQARLGLDRPLPVQFAIYLKEIATLDLGRSIFLDRPVAQAIAERAQLTGLLTALAATIAVLIGVPVGILSAVRRGRASDHLATAGAMVFASLPSFWVGLTLIEWLAVRHAWFPVAGWGDPGDGLLAHLHHLVLPAVALGLPNSALIIRFTRTSMLDVLGEDYIRTARAKGVRPWSVVMRHALRNALIPIVTVIGLTVATLIGGAIVTETVFGLPGVGNLIVSAVLRRDYPVIQGTLLVISGLYVLINLAVDLLYAAVDPRLRG